VTLIDTCVWIYFLGGRQRTLVDEVARLVQADEVLGHPFVHGELLMGTGGNSRVELLRSYPDLAPAPVSSHQTVVELVRKHRLANRGLGWIDAHLLAAAKEAGAKLWTEEAALKQAARELGLAL
jgi:hypothetical protein